MFFHKQKLMLMMRISNPKHKVCPRCLVASPSPIQIKAQPKETTTPCEKFRNISVERSISPACYYCAANTPDHSCEVFATSGVKLPVFCRNITPSRLDKAHV